MMLAASERAARIVLLAEGVALLWIALGTFVFGLVLGGLVAGFGGGQATLPQIMGAGALPLACGLAILGTRDRMTSGIARVVAFAAQVGVFALAGWAAGPGTWVSAAAAVVGCLGIAAAARLAISGDGASPSTTA